MSRWKVGILTPRKQSEAGYALLEEAGCELIYGVSYDEFPEGTITLMLAVLKRVGQLDRHTRSGKWKNTAVQPMLLRGKTVGLIGFGRVGRAVAERLRGWDVSIRVYDPHVPDEDIHAFGAEPAALEVLLSSADIVSSHVVLTPDTSHLLNRDRLQLLKPAALLECLQSGKKQ